MNYELAIDEDGEPFEVPPHVWGWRVRRAADRRGRPHMVFDKGKPLIVRATAPHSELLAAAGPGRYKLDAVDEQRRSVQGVPVACTGPLTADGQAPSEDDDGELPGGSAVRQVSSLEDALVKVVNANTRVMETALGQMSNLMGSVAELLHAAHSTGITTRVPLPSAPPPLWPVDSHDDEEDDNEDRDQDDGEDQDEDDEREVASQPSVVPEVIKLIIKETVDKVVAIVFEKITSGGGIGGLPWEAILDWRKVPRPSEAPSAQAQATAPGAPAATASAHVPFAAPSSPGGPYPPHVATPPSVPASAPAPIAATPNTPRTTTTAPAGAAPGPLAPLGAAPAAMPVSSAAGPPRNQEDLTALVNTHILQVWQGLSPPDRVRVGTLIGRMSVDERTTWLTELVGLSVTDAIARTRAFLHAQDSPAPTTPQIATTTPKGDPS